MPLLAQTLELHDDAGAVAEYVAHHRRVWPEVVKALEAIGIRWMRIWLHGNRLFMVMEVPPDFDASRDYQRYAADPRAREWDELMRRFQRRVPAADPEDGLWWSPMREIFALGPGTAPSLDPPAARR